MSMSRNKLLALCVAGAVLVAAVAGAGWWFLKDRTNTITVTAQFDSAAGLYEGNTVAVLGMQVGRVIKITPKGNYVEVEFTVDKDVSVPADAQAVTISNSILTDRQIELTPAVPRRGDPAEPRHDRPEPDQDPGRVRPGARRAGQAVLLTEGRRQGQRTSRRRGQRERRDRRRKRPADEGRPR